MRTLLRSLLFLALAVWLGGEFFFPFVAAITFNTLSPETHTAGAIVGHLLRILHQIGLISGLLALASLALLRGLGIYKRGIALVAILLLALMLGLTAYSQLGIIPAMERDRINCGGAIDQAELSAPCRVDFERLHHRSEAVEGAVLLLGLLTLVSVARAESARN
jgi:hypothetical protein